MIRRKCANNGADIKERHTPQRSAVSPISFRRVVSAFASNRVSEEASNVRASAPFKRHSFGERVTRLARILRGATATRYTPTAASFSNRFRAHIHAASETRGNATADARRRLRGQRASPSPRRGRRRHQTQVAAAERQPRRRRPRSAPK